MFSGISVFIAPYKISKLQQKLIKNAIESRGGKVGDEVSSQTTHIITIKPEDYVVTSKVPHNIQIVAPDFISNSIRLGQLTLKKNDISNTEKIPLCPTAGKPTEKAIEKLPAKRKLEINENALITDEFELLVKRAEAEGNQWRIRAYKRAISILKTLPKVTCADQVSNISGIGTQIRVKIEEVLGSGKVQKAHDIPDQFKLLEKFMKIYGVGRHTAERFVAKGYTKLEDVAKDSYLTIDQQLGLKYYQDFLERIPRSECTEMLNLFRQSVLELDPGLECFLMGSYLRGMETCGDVDFMVTHIDGVSHEGILPNIVKLLRSKKFIMDDLTTPESNSYRGVCKLPNPSYIHARRIDILIVPQCELGAAKIYFTGDDFFNRKLRALAGKKGMTLNQHGLFLRETCEDDFAGTSRLIASKTEEEIFEKLGSLL